MSAHEGTQLALACAFCIAFIILAAGRVYALIRPLPDYSRRRWMPPTMAVCGIAALGALVAARYGTGWTLDDGLSDPRAHIAVAGILAAAVLAVAALIIAGRAQL